MLVLKRCPKTGRLLRMRGTNRRSTALSLVAGVVALLWVLGRVLTKPSRATYPCVRVATPLATSLLTYVVSVGLVTAIWRRAAEFAHRARYALATAAAVLGGVAAVYGGSLSSPEAKAENVGAFTPTDAPNSPIGVAKGIKPGRVTWAYDQTATNITGTGSYADDANTSKVKVRAMIERAICALTDKATISDAWSALFVHFNSTHGAGETSYKAGEKVAIKINLNNGGGTTAIDATPQSVHALLYELVNVVGVAQADISIYDTMRRTAMGRVKAACQTDFPNVHYNDGSKVAAITFSRGGIATKNVGTEVVNAKYLFNMALLKRHGRPDPNWNESMGNTGITLTFKNHCGTVDNCSSLHNELRDWNQPFGSYNPLVDLMASKNVGQKTVLFLIDALYSGNLWSSGPQKWQLAPFSGDYPSSIFASQDPVAIDSVGLDFLRAEWQLIANADNYLHEAALIGSAPSGTVYKPDGSAVTQSLGVHEHWNNSKDKKYTRNLDTIKGKGIELVRAEGYVFSGSATGGAGGASTGGSSTGGVAASGGGARNAGGMSAGGAATGGVGSTAGGRTTSGTTATSGGAAAGGVLAMTGGRTSGGTDAPFGGAHNGGGPLGGATSATGAVPSNKGGQIVGGAGLASLGGADHTSGTAVSPGGALGVDGDATSDAGGCSCRTGQSPNRGMLLLGFVGWLLVTRRRRQQPTWRWLVRRDSGAVGGSLAPDGDMSLDGDVNLLR